MWSAHPERHGLLLRGSAWSGRRRSALAAVAGRRGDPGTGALLIGAAEAARATAGATRQPDEDAWVLETEIALRGALGERAYAEAVGEGGRLELGDAVGRALAIRD